MNRIIDAIEKEQQKAEPGNFKVGDSVRVHTRVIEGDKEKRQIVIRDNGVGMTHDELVKNLGTIAHSGSLEFIKTLSASGKTDASLIG